MDIIVKIEAQKEMTFAEIARLATEKRRAEIANQAQIEYDIMMKRVNEELPHVLERVMDTIQAAIEKGESKCTVYFGEVSRFALDTYKHPWFANTVKYIWLKTENARTWYCHDASTYREVVANTLENSGFKTRAFEGAIYSESRTGMSSKNFKACALTISW